MNEKIVVWHYVLMYNEMRILPLMVKYWRTYASKVIVLDSHSTDGSIEYLKSIDDMDIEIRERCDVHMNELDDEYHAYLKNNIWKEARGKADFVVVSDCDETLLSKNGTSIVDELSYMKEHGMTIIHPDGYLMCSLDFPDYEDRMLHEYEPKVMFDNMQCKNILFDPDAIDEINFTPGAHACNPKGNVVYYDRNKIIEIHLHNLGIYFKLEHYHRGKKRLSQNNINAMYGFQYMFDDNKVIEDFRKEYARCVDIQSILSS